MIKFVTFCLIVSIAAAAHIPSRQNGHRSFSPRIVGGKDAADGQIPFQCSLQLRSQHFCGCAIISSKWILTAAHCFIGKKAEEIEILVGTNKLNSGGTRYNIGKNITHELYGQEGGFGYDIALIYVQQTIEFTEKVKPIKYSVEQVPPGSNLQVSGWGKLSQDGPMPNNLQVLNVTSISQEECVQILGGKVHKSHLCTSSPASTGVCSGDSGGPVVLDNDLVGIVNWGINGCAHGYPDGHAKIAFFFDWIEQKTASE